VVPRVSFDRALARVLGYEGGLSDNPADRGGRTDHGITQRTYDAWRTTTGQAKRPVDYVTDDEVRAIYLSDYWMPCNCDSLPENLAEAVFDMAVNSGVWNTKLALQRAVRVQADGVIGPQTVAAAQAAPDAVLAFLKQRAGLIAEILATKPSQTIFAGGWISRLLEQAWALK
jgi:lysozyme family protein